MKKYHFSFKMKRASLCFISFFIFHFSFSQTITTIAGCDSGGFSGDGGPTTLAELAIPVGVAVDGLGNVYIADEGNSRIRIINSTVKKNRIKDINNYIILLIAN
jgi:hypothetical protein